MTFRQLALNRRCSVTPRPLRPIDRRSAATDRRWWPEAVYRQTLGSQPLGPNEGSILREFKELGQRPDHRSRLFLAQVNGMVLTEVKRDMRSPWVLAPIEKQEIEGPQVVRYHGRLAAVLPQVA